MHAGYKNFQPVQKGEVLGDYGGREMKTPVTGQVFMPLYQKQGQECFYIIKPIDTFWIKLSIKFRGFRHHDKLDWLLGVKKIGTAPLAYRLHDEITFFWQWRFFIY